MKQFFTLLLSLSVIVLYAQAPANDDCSGLIDLGSGENCSQTDIYSNINATASDIGFEDFPFCSPDNTAPRDVWFSFTAPSDVLDYTVTITGVEGPNGESAMTNPQVAIYRGACQMDGLSLLACASEIEGDTLVDVDVLGLTPGQTYFIRVTDFADPGDSNEGTFNVCIEEFEPIFTVDEEGSNLCEGFLFDTGGPDGDYGNDENHVFSICPTLPSACINLSFEYYNIEYEGFDEIIIYDSDTADPGSIIANIGGNAFGAEGGGAVCFETQASSGCVTVQFISDGTSTFEGFSAAWSCSQEPCTTLDPIALNSNISNQDIVNTLTSPASQVTVTNLDCADGAYGLFLNGDDTDLGINRGILLTSGSAANAVGPNTLGGVGQSNNFLGDADLDSLSNIFGDSIESNDACILELEIFANTDELSFEYVFGSEEYPEFVGDGFNDIFAFLVSGPGITGIPQVGNQENIAVLPNGSFVQIDNLNNAVNWEYYRNNEFGQSIQYDGLTSDFLGTKKSLTASIDVTPCETYNLKLAVADRGDFIFDSGVFVGEIRGAAPDIEFVSLSGLDYVIEDCELEVDSLILRLTDIPQDTINYDIVIGGTATQGMDYNTTLPSSITFTPQQSEFVFPLEVLVDLITEGTETIIIKLFRDFGCGSVEVDELVVELREEVNINIEVERDTFLACQLDTFQLEASGAQEYLWTPEDVVVEGDSLATVSLALEQSQFVYVTGFVGNGCVGTDSVFVEIVDPMVSIDQMGPIGICAGDSAILSLNSNIDLSRDEAVIEWTPGFSVTPTDSSTVFATPFFTTLYTANLSIGGCTVTDTITVDVDQLRTPNVIEDATICQNFSIELTDDPFFFFNQDNSYTWMPADGLDDPNAPQPTATPDQTTTYTLISGVTNGATCGDTLDVTITVIPADVDILEPDTVLLCIGDQLDLTAVTSTGSSDSLVWSSSNGLLNAENTFDVSLVPDRSGTYYAGFNVNGCFVVDSVIAFVDSIPFDLNIIADPDQETYCEGDQVILTSNIYDPVDFPRISHVWGSGGPGYQTGDTLFNMVLNVVDTFLYTRVTTSGACVDSASIQIDVIPLANLTITPDEQETCLGDAVTLTATYDGEGDITWEPDLGCTGDDCLEVTVNPPSSTVYVAMAENEGCPVEAQAVVTVIGAPNPNVPAQATTCEGVPRRLALSAPEPGTTYQWTSPDLPNFMSDDLNVEVILNQDATFNLVATNSCFTVERTIMVMVVPQPDPSIIDPLTICQGETVTLSDATPQDLVNYEWTANGNPVGTDLNLEVTPTSTTTYVLTASNTCGEVILPVTITVIQMIDVDIPDNIQLCQGQSATLNNLGAQLGVTYSWTSDPVDPNLDANIAQPVVMPTQTTTYTLSANSENGCFMEDQSVTVVVVEEPNITLDVDTDICEGESITAVAMNDAPDNVDLSYLWTINGQPVGGDESMVTIGPENLVDTSQLTLVVTYGDNCGTVQLSQVINVFDLSFDFIIEQEPDTTIFAGQSVTLFAVADPSPSVTATYTWSEAGTIIDGATGASVTVTPPIPSDAMPGDVVPVRYEVTASFGPLSCEVVAILVINVRIPQSDIPNVFTPNGDGTNDRFRVFSEIVPEIISMEVYNRWGQIVYEGTDPDGWDGTYENEPAPSDVYIYKVVYRLGNFETEQQGEITLLR